MIGVLYRTSGRSIWPGGRLRTAEVDLVQWLSPNRVFETDEG
jgi:hypothetical protein